jgi:hypothetical protein
VDDPRSPEEPPGDEPEDDEPEEPVPPVGATEPLGVIELLREEIGGRFGRLFRRR